MNILQVLRLLSVLLLIISGFMATPLIVALFYDELFLSTSFLIPICGMVLFYVLLRLITKKPEKTDVATQEGFLLVALSWLSASLFGCLPFYLSGYIPSFTDAFFETMSGFTTTGASILVDIERLPHALLFWRSLTHWLGGMGIVVLTIAIFPLLGFGAFQLLKAEAPGPTVDKITPRIKETAKILWMIYVGLTVAETVLLLIGGMNLFEALTHTFGTLATGGFSPKAASVGHYQSAYIHIVVTVFMLCAGINFILYFKLVTGKLEDIARNSEIKFYLSVFAIATLIIAISLYQNRFDTFGESLRYGGFQAASILTTTGYVTDDFAAWPTIAKGVLFLLMFVGGCSGSTGGGIKVVRVLTLVKQGFTEMKYLTHPKGIFSVHISGEKVKKNIIYSIYGFVTLYFAMLFIITVAVSSGGNDLLTSFSTSLVTVGNIGPGFGSIGPTLNYSFYQDYIKWFLSFAMMIGRLEVYTVLVLFTPMFWKK
jgi:trk system potassium uptake protein TrkH